MSRAVFFDGTDIVIADSIEKANATWEFMVGELRKSSDPGWQQVDNNEDVMIEYASWGQVPDVGTTNIPSNAIVVQTESGTFQITAKAGEWAACNRPGLLGKIDRNEETGEGGWDA